MAHQAAASTSQAAPCASSPTGVSVIHHGQRVDEKLSAEQVRSKVLRQVRASLFHANATLGHKRRAVT